MLNVAFKGVSFAPIKVIFHIYRYLKSITKTKFNDIPSLESSSANTDLSKANLFDSVALLRAGHSTPWGPMKNQSLRPCTLYAWAYPYACECDHMTL